MTDIPNYFHSHEKEACVHRRARDAETERDLWRDAQIGSAKLAAQYRRQRGEWKRNAQYQETRVRDTEAEREAILEELRALVHEADRQYGNIAPDMLNGVIVRHTPKP